LITLYLIILSAAGIIVQLNPAVSQRFRFHISYFSTKYIGITLKLLKLCNGTPAKKFERPSPSGLSDPARQTRRRKETGYC
jgi:hypothetical protein